MESKSVQAVVVYIPDLKVMTSDEFERLLSELSILENWWKTTPRITIEHVVVRIEMFDVS